MDLGRPQLAGREGRLGFGEQLVRRRGRAARQAQQDENGDDLTQMQHGCFLRGAPTEGEYISAPATAEALTLSAVDDRIAEAVRPYAGQEPAR